MDTLVQGLVNKLADFGNIAPERKYSRAGGHNRVRGNFIADFEQNGKFQLVRERIEIREMSDVWPFLQRDFAKPLPAEAAAKAFQC